MSFTKLPTYSRNALAVIFSLQLCLWASTLRAEDTPATKPALASDFCTISDYCTIVLAPKVQDVLACTGDERATLVKERDRLELMLSGAAGRGPSGQAGATILLGTARRCLEIEGQRIRDLLTLEQDKKLQDLFANKTLKPIGIEVAKANTRGRGGGTYGEIQLTYTHYSGALPTPPDTANNSPAKTPAPQLATNATPTPVPSAAAQPAVMPPADATRAVVPAAPSPTTTTSDLLAASFAATIQNGLANKTYVAGSTKGGAFAKDPYEDLPPEGAILIGFRCNMGKFVNNETITGIQPVFLSDKGQLLGKLHGKASERVIDIIARPGYAVGSVAVAGGGGLDSVVVTFMRITDGKLNPQDSYAAAKVGGSGGGNPVKFGGDGTPIIGLTGKADEKGDVALGFIFLSATPTAKGSR